MTFGIGCAGTKHIATKTATLDGTWVPVSQEMAGTLLPMAVLEKQKLVMKDSTYTVTAESIDKGVVKYGEGKMDIYGRDGVNAGRHFTAIYKFENDELTICYNLVGDGYPVSFDTKGKRLHFLSVYKRQ
jgi:uncharacterized protein (TIGR03067 family)